MFDTSKSPDSDGASGEDVRQVLVELSFMQQRNKTAATSTIESLQS
jgi:hypothetical protein